VDVSVAATEDGAAEIALGDDKSVRVPKEPGQVGIDEARTAEDGKTTGWLVMYKDLPSVSYPTSGKLVIWRGGKVLHRFDSEQVFYSWGFYAGGTQVAFHTGPLHGE